MCMRICEKCFPNKVFVDQCCTVSQRQNFSSNLSPLLNGVMLLRSDPAGAGVRSVCGLVGAGGADVWDDGRTTPIWSRQWRRLVWVHPPWRCPLSRVAQQGGRFHPSSGTCRLSAGTRPLLYYRDLIVHLHSCHLLLKSASCLCLWRDV